MITIELLEKQLKSKELHSLYLFYGEERYLLENTVKKIKTLFGELIKGINYIELDESNVQELISDIQTPAFGFDKKLIIVKNAGLFQKEGKKKNNIVGIKEKLEEYLRENSKQIEESVILVMLEETVEKSSLLATFEELHAVICQFEFQKPIQIGARIKGICSAYQVQIEDKTISYFMEVVGNNMQDIINEIRKQIEFVGDNGTITKETIDSLAIKQIESIIFELTDKLGNRKIAEAMQVLHNLIYTKEPVQKILITLYNHFKKIYLVKLAIKHNRNIAEALNLKPNQMFLTTKYKAQSNYFEEKELKQILQEFINLDANYKVGLIDITIGLEAILCRYCS